MKLSLLKRIRVYPAETSMVVTIVMFTQSFSVVRASFSSIQFALGLISITSIGWGWDAIPLSKPLRLSPQPSCARIPLVSSKASKLIRQRNQGQIERQHPTEDIQ